MVQSLLGGGAADQCPMNICEYTAMDSGGNSRFVRFTCGAGGICAYISLDTLNVGLYEAGGTFMTGDQYKQWTLDNFAAAIEAQKQATARKLAEELGISYDEAYEMLGDPEDGFVKGGNFNFQIDSGLYDKMVQMCGGDRCDDGLHFIDGGFVHLDTAYPFGSPGGFLAHTFVDIIAGNLFFTLIPRH